VFSKCLQWLDYPGMAGITAEAGFDGVDLTVRAGGHVLPERVEEDLPKAVEAAEPAFMSDDRDRHHRSMERHGLRSSDGGRLGIKSLSSHLSFNDSDPVMATGESSRGADHENDNSTAWQHAQTMPAPLREARLGGPLLRV
jgi:hypothetical protein